MDRNAIVNTVISCITVALRKESVDRNLPNSQRLSTSCLSLSARRAWIEIAYGALEGASEMSLSARRAWIEISITVTRTPIGCGRSPQGERG